MSLADWLRHHAFNIVLLAVIVFGGALTQQHANRIERNSDRIDKFVIGNQRQGCELGNGTRGRQRALLTVLIHNSDRLDVDEARLRKTRASIPFVDCARLFPQP